MKPNVLQGIYYSGIIYPFKYFKQCALKSFVTKTKLLNILKKLLKKRGHH